MSPIQQEAAQGANEPGRVQSVDQTKAEIQEDLDLVHWHMLRGDGLRASLVNRAGSVLSTNALIVAGVALAIGLRSQHPGLDVLIPTLAALVCVAASVVNASMVMITLRPWRSHFKATDTPQPFLYSYAGMRGDFAAFKKEMRSQSPE